MKYACKVCSKEFSAFPSDKRKYCSLHCRSISFTGRAGWSKNMKFPERSGARSATWKGGRIKTTRGYIMILSTEHPFTGSTGYVSEHRLVMEKKIGRYLETDEVVHHINRVKSDNRVENLELVNSTEHRRIHNREFWDNNTFGSKREVVDGCLKCITCKFNLPVDNFHKDSKRLCGYQRVCKDCRKVYYLQNK